jgi:hypothetical protein
MADSLDKHSSAREIARRDRVYAAHVFLCVCMLAWRMLEATPGVASTQNGSFAGSTLGLALTMSTVWLGVLSLVAITAWTVATRNDKRLWILLVLMSLSMLWRRDIDVFDITYVASVAILSAWWFNAGRGQMKSTLVATQPTPSRAS